MHRFLVSLSSAAILTMAAQAQCFEADFGTFIGTGDDVLLPSVAMNINFPMGGTFATYDHVQINTNGCAFLWNGVGTPVGTLATGYSASAATMVANMQGTPGGSPRISPYWRDLDAAQVYVNTNIPGKCTITWANALDWQFGGTPFTFQAQLFATGEVQFLYDAASVNLSVTPLAGISQGGGIADPGASDLSVATSGVSTSRFVYETWATASTFDLTSMLVSFTQNAGGGYDTTPSATPANCVHASHQQYGTGCYTQNDTVYQFSGSAVVAQPALQGNVLLLAATGTGYRTSWLPGIAGALYVPPTGGATLLAPADDGTETVTPPSIPFPVPGGSATNFTVGHNGIVTMGSAGNQTGDYSPTGAEVAASTNAAFYSWSDFNDENVGSGSIKTEEVLGVYYVTWDGVDHWSGFVGNNPCTVQFQFDLNTGNVTIVWVTVDPDATSAYGSAWLVGATLPGVGANAGSKNLATGPLTVGSPDQAPAISLSAAPIPIISPSTMVTYTASNIPEFVPTSGVYLSTMFLSVNPNPFGFDLFGILTNTPGCNAWILSLDLDLGGQLTLAPVASWNFTFDNTFFAPGNVVAAQAVALYDGSFPLYNGENGGFVTSNAVLSTTQPQ